MDNLEGVSCTQEFIARVAVRTKLPRLSASAALKQAVRK
jgi:hypothetical protein